MTVIELQPLTSQFLPAVIELDRLCFGQLWSLEAYQRELESPNSDLFGVFIVNSMPLESESTTRLIGYGCLWAILDEAHITIVAVHPDYRHRGLGQLLMIGLLRAARHRGLERATLEVRASNVAAVSLYEKFGFTVAGRRRRYYQNPEEDGLILWRGGLQLPDFQQSLEEWDRKQLLSSSC